MNLLHYVQRLAPVNDRRELSAIVVQLQESLTVDLIPFNKVLLDYAKGRKWKSANAKQLEKVFRQVYRTGGGLEDVMASLVDLRDNLDWLKAEINKAFGLRFTTQGLTYRRVAIMRYVEAMLFYVDYYRKLIHHVLAQETVAINSQATPYNASKAEREWLADNITRFVQLVHHASLPRQQLVALFDSVLQAEVDPELHDALLTTQGVGKVDPIRVDGISPRMWALGMGKIYAEWSVKHYQFSKEELQGAQLRLQELRELEEQGKLDPSLQKLLRYTEERIETLSYRVTKFEEANVLSA